MGLSINFIARFINRILWLATAIRMMFGGVVRRAPSPVSISDYPYVC